MTNNQLLAVWIIADTVQCIAIIFGTAYLVFYKDASGWWFVLSIMLCTSPTLFKALKKVFSLKDESS